MSRWDFIVRVSFISTALFICFHLIVVIRIRLLLGVFIIGLPPVRSTVLFTCMFIDLWGSNGENKERVCVCSVSWWVLVLLSGLQQ